MTLELDVVVMGGIEYEHSSQPIPFSALNRPKRPPAITTKTANDRTPEIQIIADS